MNLSLPKSVISINYPSIKKFIAHEDARGASAHHIRESLVLLGGIMKYAVRQRLVESNPVQEVEKPKGRSKYKASDEMDILRPDEIRISGSVQPNSSAIFPERVSRNGSMPAVTL